MPHALAITLLLISKTFSLEISEIQQFDQTQVTFTENGDFYEFTAKGYPQHDIDPSVDPNNATEQNFKYNITRSPVVGDGVYCSPMGAIGFATNGVALYNALTDYSLDAVIHETFDSCKGHTDMSGTYHYHQFPACLGDMNQTDLFIGIAIDGFPIYGPMASDRSEPLKAADLDLCHGRMVNGKYRYHITVDFPYVIGCFRAKPAESAVNRSPYGEPSSTNNEAGTDEDEKPDMNDMSFCTNEDFGAQLCDCKTHKTYNECVASAEDATCGAQDTMMSVSLILLGAVISGLF